jgi:hypothetical protein
MNVVYTKETKEKKENKKRFLVAITIKEQLTIN